MYREGKGMSYLMSCPIVLSRERVQRLSEETGGSTTFPLTKRRLEGVISCGLRF